MQVHGYTKDGSIDVTIDGTRMTVPNNLANRHRQEIAKWEAEGNTIPAYVEPPPSPEQIRDATFKADADRIDMVTRLKTATPAQIKSYIQANVTNLAQARTYLEKLTLVLATAIRD